MAIKFNNLNTVQTKVYKFPAKMNKNVRQLLYGEGFAIVQRNILRHMPVSKANKVHAKQSKSIRRMALKKKRKNQIGFYTTYYKKFWYMKFPEDGTVHQRAQGFTKKGGRDSQRPIQLLVNTAVRNSSRFL